MITPEICLTKFGPPTAPTFEPTWMALYEVPEATRTLIKCLPKKIYCHKLMVDPLRKAFENIIMLCIEEEFKTWDGCFNIRKMRGLNSMSIHSWGLAVDVNAAENGLGVKPKLSKEFVSAFKSAGFDWGGEWKRLDGMHFQLAKV